MRVLDHIHKNGWHTETNGFNRAVVLKQAFTEVYKIGNVSDDPFELVIVRPADGFHELNPMYRLMEDYDRYKIQKYYGISYLEFEKLPRHKSDHMIELAKIKRDKEVNASDETEADLKRALADQAQRKHEMESDFPNI